MLSRTLPRELRDLMQAGSNEAARLLYEQCEPNALDMETYGFNIFGHPHLTREIALLAKERGADINLRNYYGKTPLFSAARMDGDIPLLLELGADMQVFDNEGLTALHLAAMRGRAKAVRALLKAGMPVDTPAAGPSHYSPLEKMLTRSDLSFTKKYAMSKLLLSKGAQPTPRCGQFAAALSELFHRHTAGLKPSKFLSNQEQALAQLCQMFGAEMRPAAEQHDGQSPVLTTTVGGFKNNYAELWRFLVPPSGRAQTAQGEVIRIAGRIEHELLGNGGLNWDEDYRQMLLIFREYMNSNNPLETPPEYVDNIVAALIDGAVDDPVLWRLEWCARHWVENNPEVMPLLPAAYSR